MIKLYLIDLHIYDIFLDEHVCTSYFSSIHVFYYHDAFIKLPLTTVTVCVCSCSKQAQVSAITHLQGINIKHQQGINVFFTQEG